MKQLQFTDGSAGIREMASHPVLAAVAAQTYSQPATRLVNSDSKYASSVVKKGIAFTKIDIISIQFIFE